MAFWQMVAMSECRHVVERMLAQPSSFVAFTFNLGAWSLKPLAPLPDRIYYLEDPAAYQLRYELIDEVTLPLLIADADKSGDERLKFALLGKQAGLGADAYTKAMRWVGRSDRLAYNDFKNSVEWLHAPAIFELDRLFSHSNADELLMSEREFRKEAISWRDLAEQAAWHELESALMTGTRPVLWQALPGKPCVHNARFGKGSLFVVAYRGQQFAITARHVVDGVDPAIFRLMLPESQRILPVLPGREAGDEASINNLEEEDDIFAWGVDIDKAAAGIQWWSWILDGLSRPASDLAPGQRLYAAGYPHFEENIDVEKFDIVENPFIASGHLASHPLVEGVYSLILDETLPDVDLDGMSGGPVFARFGEKFHYVGMCLRGGGKPAQLHFISAEYVIGFLNRVVDSAPVAVP